MCFKVKAGDCSAVAAGVNVELHISQYICYVPTALVALG
jgi:hypothetical protein